MTTPISPINSASRFAHAQTQMGQLAQSGVGKSKKQTSGTSLLSPLSSAVLQSGMLATTQLRSGFSLRSGGAKSSLTFNSARAGLAKLYAGKPRLEKSLTITSTRESGEEGGEETSLDDDDREYQAFISKVLEIDASGQKGSQEQEKELRALWNKLNVRTRAEIDLKRPSDIPEPESRQLRDAYAAFVMQDANMAAMAKLVLDQPDFLTQGQTLGDMLAAHLRSPWVQGEPHILMALRSYLALFMMLGTVTAEIINLYAWIEDKRKKDEEKKRKAMADIMEGIMEDTEEKKKDKEEDNDEKQ